MGKAIQINGIDRVRTKSSTNWFAAPYSKTTAFYLCTICQ